MLSFRGKDYNPAVLDKQRPRLVEDNLALSSQAQAKKTMKLRQSVQQSTEAD